MTINELVKAAHANAVAKGFWPTIHAEYSDPPSYTEKLFLVVSELVEAGEELRSGHAPDEIYVDEVMSDLQDAQLSKPEGVPIELADAVIRIMDFCGYAGIDLEAAIELKMKFNTTRPHLHGKKF